MERAMGDLGKLVLRVSIGVLLLFHGISKVVKGIGPIMGLVQKAGLPAEIAYLVLIGEVIAPVLLIMGLWTRPAALIVVINMLFAIGLAHTGQLLQLSGNGGWALELQGLYLCVALAIAMIGGGRYVASRRWN
jgi:putative oxidoreductase